MNVAVIGASDKASRYSHQAVMLLKKYGHAVFPVHPRTAEIEGIKVYPAIGDIDAPIDTVTLYLNAAASSAIAREILAKTPKRIIFNPGAENPDLQALAGDKGILTLKACTLVLLKTGRF